MVNRMNALGNYNRHVERENQYSYISDPVAELRRDTDKRFKTIEFNITLMKDKRVKYRRDTTSRSEK
jgi:hypothetical protein